MTLGTLIRGERLKNPKFRQTMKALADACGISLEHMRRIELGYAYPSGDLLEKIVGILGMNAEMSSQAWLLLAQRQLDPETQKHVSVLSDKNGMAAKAAKSAAKWVEKHYAFSEEDLKELSKAVLRDLRK
jgi:transcriptional regulator with XRE-family HTH domain